MQKFKEIVKESLEKTLNVEISRPRKKKLIINEAINFDKEVIFVAIPKTGTTSVRTQIKQEGKPLIDNQHLDILQIRDLIYFDLLRKTLGTNYSFPNPDRPSNSALRDETEKIFNSFFKFSAVRNPWARAVSLYFRREGVQLKDKMSFHEFCEKHMYASDTCRHPTLHKNQYDWLSSEDGKILVDYFYKVEEFENAIIDIKKRTNERVVLVNKTLNKNPNSKSSDYRNLYNDRTRKIIEKRFEKDIDYFKYTF